MDEFDHREDILSSSLQLNLNICSTVFSFFNLLMREAHEKCVKRWPGLRLLLFIVTPKVVLSLDFFLVRCHSEVSEFVVVKNQPSPAG